MLRGINPRVTRQALAEIVRRLAVRHMAVLLAGMRAAPNLGSDYGRDFEAIYVELAARYGLLLYPFFLDGGAGRGLQEDRTESGEVSMVKFADEGAATLRPRGAEQSNLRVLRKLVCMRCIRDA
jgi:lysophospholipase L1-like esterase